jgi:hypothetical protein
VAESEGKKVPKDYEVDIPFNGPTDNKENQFGDWVFFRVQFIPPVAA